MSDQAIPPVVVGVDGSDLSGSALDLAADEAAARAATLVLVHAGGGEPAADAAIVKAVDRVHVRHPGMAVSPRRADGRPGDALAAAAIGAGLIAVGHRGHSGRGGTTAGSVALGLVGHAAVPLLVYRPYDKDVDRPRPVLLGVLGDAAPDAAVEFAFAQASRRGAPLQVVFVRSEPDGALDPDAIARWSRQYPDVKVHIGLRYGLDAAIALTAASHTAKLVVVSEGPDSTRTSAVYALVHRAGCPVAVIPAHRDRRNHPGGRLFVGSGGSANAVGRV
jgi:nucleotide-binding universal stress UspA family protein